MYVILSYLNVREIISSYPISMHREEYVSRRVKVGGLLTGIKISEYIIQSGDVLSKVELVAANDVTIKTATKWEVCIGSVEQDTCQQKIKGYESINKPYIFMWIWEHQNKKGDK